METLPVVDAIAWIRSDPSRFFAMDTVDPIRLIAYVMSDVLELGTGTFVARSCGEWWIVGSDVDWISKAGLPLVELFARVVAVAGRGTHTMRAEVLIAAFARDVAVRISHERRLVQGELPEEDVWSRGDEVRCEIAFRI